MDFQMPPASKLSGSRTFSVPDHRTRLACIPPIGLSRVCSRSAAIHPPSAPRFGQRKPVSMAPSQSLPGQRLPEHHYAQITRPMAHIPRWCGPGPPAGPADTLSESGKPGYGHMNLTFFNAVRAYAAVTKQTNDNKLSHNG